MRTLALLLAIAAGPAAGQVHARLNTGYDLGYNAPSVGGGLEAAVSVPSAPLTVGLRVSTDIVFVDGLSYASPLTPGLAGIGLEADVYRLSLEVVSYADLDRPVRPYVKAGLVTEYEFYDPAVRTSQAWTDAVAGFGIEVGRVSLEGTHGFGDASRRRLAIGVRL